MKLIIDKLSHLCIIFLKWCIMCRHGIANEGKILSCEPKQQLWTVISKRQRCWSLVACRVLLLWRSKNPDGYEYQLEKAIIHYCKIPLLWATGRFVGMWIWFLRVVDMWVVIVDMWAFFFLACRIWFRSCGYVGVCNFFCGCLAQKKMWACKLETIKIKIKMRAKRACGRKMYDTEMYINRVHINFLGSWSVLSLCKSSLFLGIISPE